jgi:hypothetical protein
MKKHILALAALSTLAFAAGRVHADPADPSQSKGRVTSPETNPGQAAPANPGQTEPSREVTQPIQGQAEPSREASQAGQDRGNLENDTVDVTARAESRTIRMLYYYNQREIYFAKLYMYLERSGNGGEVYSHARRIANSLTEANNRLVSMASFRGLELGDAYAWADAGRSPRRDNSVLTNEDRRIRNEMILSQNSDIDFIYISNEMNFHAEAYQELKAAAARSVGIRSVAAFELPLIAENYKRAKRVNRDLCNGSPTICFYSH